MLPKEMKDRLYEQFSRIGKAISSPQRLEIIEILAQGERTVERVADALSIPIANASHHLQALRAARLLDSRREGKFIHYRLSEPDVFQLVRVIRTLAERHLAEVDRIVTAFFQSRDGLEPVSHEELLARARVGDVLVLDVRPVEEYRAGHLAGALSIPLDQLEQRLAELPPEKEVVAYCRGPYCVMSLEAVERLRARGWTARRLVDGFPDWVAAGLPVEASANF